MGKDPVEILLNEHRVVEEILDGLEWAAKSFRSDPSPPVREAAELVWFLRGFVDGCHHAKEEELLFPLLETRGLSPNLGPTAAMRLEHRLGGRLIEEMETSLQTRSGKAGLCRFVQAASAYAGLLRGHIRKEDHCVFGYAGRLLDEGEKATLAAAFRRVDAEFAAREGGAHLRRAMAILDLVARWKGRPTESGRLLTPAGYPGPSAGVLA